MLSTAVHAQTPELSIESALLAKSGALISVEFTHPVESTGPHTDNRRVHIRNATLVEVGAKIVRSSLENDVLNVPIQGELPLGQRVEICFEAVRFIVEDTVHETTSEICRTIGTAAEVAAARAAALKVLQDVPQPAREKDIFASGFVTSASEESAGGADLSFNPDFTIPNLNAFLQLKKASADEGDARNFEAGARYRYTQTWNPGQMRQIAQALPGETLNRLLRERQGNIIAGWLLDFAGKLEADPTNFDVTNFVGESSFQIRTMTKGFFSRKGFWRGFVLPVGVEFGQGLGTAPPSGDTPPPAGEVAQEVNRIARYKAGAGFTLYYDNPGTPLPLRRVEVDINGILRHLFLSESRFNTETKAIDMTDDGLHGYAQVDLKVFFAETDAGRYGFKLSLNRGRLPPVYAEVNSFDFGFVIESGDDDDTTTAEKKATAPGRRPTR